MQDEVRFSLILWSTNIGALAAFLVEVAGMRLEEQHPGYASLSTDGFWLQIHGDEAYRGHPWYDALHTEGLARGIGAELRMRVDDVDAAYGRALKLEAPVLYPPFVDNGYLECHVMAPDGYMVSLWGPAHSR